MTHSDQTFERCMKCTICNDYCPMLAVNPLFPGPKSAGPDGERYRLKDGRFYDNNLKYCLNCKRCELACPSGVHIADLVQLARLEKAPDYPCLRDVLLGNTDFVGKLAVPMSPLVNSALKMSFVQNLLDYSMGVDAHRIFPDYAKQRFVRWYKKEAAEQQAAYSQQVSYFHGCYVNYNYPRLGRDLVRVLNAVGVGVQLLEDECCCGVALLANGMKKKAARHAKTNLKAVRASLDKGLPVLATGSTCVLTLREEYPNVLGIDNSDVKEGITLATRWLWEAVEAGRIQLRFRPDYHKRIAYHAPCHLEKLGWSIYSTELLKRIPGVEFVMLDSACCGMSGTFGFKKEYYRYAQEVGEKLFKSIREAKPDLVATDCETCKWQIEMSTGFEVAHPISILADALDFRAMREEAGNKTQ